MTFRRIAGPAGMGFLACGVIALLTACSEEKAPVRGFVLPDGDIERGAAVFVENGCVRCHTVSGSDIEQPADAEFEVPLGGTVRRVTHYGELLTSIVNPSHRIQRAYRVDSDDTPEGASSSPMLDYTTRLTVRELIDLVEFLHSKYTAIPTYEGKYYGYYVPAPG